MDRIEEYNALRQEILQKDLQYNDYRKNACTITTAILAVSLLQREPLICLVPIAVILTYYWMSEEGLRAELKMGAYLYVFYGEDGFNWEKRNMKLGEMTNSKQSKIEAFIGNNAIYIMLIIFCGLLALYISFRAHFPIWSLVWRIAVIVGVLAISILIMIKNKVYTYATRNEYIDSWSRIKRGDGEI